jgi:putative transposase
MRREGIIACTERPFRWTATGRAERPAAPNHLAQDFRATAPNQRWVSDITSIRTSQGWLHLAIVLDLFSRRIVGWAMAPTLTPALVHDALTRALTERRPAPGLLLHSDRGGQYLSSAVQCLLEQHGLVASTSRPGQGLDNAVAESFFHTLITAPGATRVSTTTRRKQNASMLGVNSVSTFLGQVQSAAFTG